MNKEKLLKLTEGSDYEKFREILVAELKKVMLSNAEDKEKSAKYLRRMIQTYDKIGSKGPWKQWVKENLK